MKYETQRTVEVVKVGDTTKVIYRPYYLARDILGVIVDYRHLKQGGKLPRYLGFSFHEYSMDAGVYYPIPFNYIMRLGRSLYWKILRAFYWVGLIDKRMEERFGWRNFFRIKMS